MLLNDAAGKFQSTLPRGERPIKPTLSKITPIISIHAPTRGATKISNCRNRRSDISIHAPTRGATRFLACRFSLRIFQSTLPRGERLPELSSPRENCNFNPRSHEGSDRAWDAGLRSSSHFNPRSHEGSDDFYEVEFFNVWGFQSTLPRGERLHSPYFEISSYNFNPRSHEGSDLLPMYPSLAAHSRFQSTLPRGERR